jgi:glycosyltransferase involved in cell wall biosynthesis
MPAGYDVYYCRRWVGAEVSPGQLARLYSMMRWADVVHLTSVYSPPTIPTLLLSKILGKPVVWTPRGSLQRWQGSTRKKIKRVWETVCNRLCDPRRVVLHFTSETEKEESQATITNARTVVVPNAIDLPGSGVPMSGVPSFGVPPSGGDFEVPSPGDDIPDIPPKGGTPNLHLLYLGRLHPIKGIENLLRAVAQTDAGVTLSICGDGDITYWRSLEAMVLDLALEDRVKFHGRVEGDTKSAEFARADVCVVPSFKENFCVVAAESLAHGVPVIASKGTPWAKVEEIGCGLWVDNSPESLVAAVQKLRAMPLREMGGRGREWMRREFSWPVVAEDMAACYGGLIAGRGKRQRAKGKGLRSSALTLSPSPLALCSSQITPVILTYDEEPNIERTLESLRWARRVVVLDSGSKDRTEEIARGYPFVDWRARVFDNHRAQWEFAICQTGITTEYVLALDADMQAPEALVSEIERDFLKGGFSGGRIPFQYQYHGRSLAGSLCPAQVRLFRVADVRIDQLAHTQSFSVTGPVYMFRSCLLHDDRKSLERWAAAQLAYQRLNEGELINGGRGRLRDRLRRAGVMPPIVGLLAYLRAGGPLKGAAAARYAYERAISEGLLAVRMMNRRLSGKGQRAKGEGRRAKR